MSPIVETKQLVPVTISGPVWVISPPDTTPRLPFTVVAANDVAPLALVLRLPFTVPPKVISPTVAVRLVAPVKRLPGLVRVMSPVVEVIEEGAPVVIAPV